MLFVFGCCRAIRANIAKKDETPSKNDKAPPKALQKPFEGAFKWLTARAFQAPARPSASSLVPRGVCGVFGCEGFVEREPQSEGNTLAV